MLLINQGARYDSLIVVNLLDRWFNFIQISFKSLTDIRQFLDDTGNLLCIKQSLVG